MEQITKFRHYFPETKVLTAGMDIMTFILTSTGKESFWKDIIWMQYTGRKDKNGTEIYRFDYVKTPAGIGMIVFIKGAYFIKWNEKDKTTLWNTKTDHLEIVGNKFEYKL